MKKQTTRLKSNVLSHICEAASTLNLGVTFVFLLGIQTVLAGSATWSANPSSGDWITPANWTPHTVPNTSSDVATFGGSSITTISGAGPALSEAVFQPGASAYTITPIDSVTLELGGAGITNNSGLGQNFVASFGSGSQARNVIMFLNSASAGTSTRFTAIGSRTRTARGGLIAFADSSSAGSGTFIAGPATGSGESGIIYLSDSSTAANGTFTSAAGDNGGAVEFDLIANGGNATFVNEGGAVSGAIGGYTTFFANSKAGSGTYTVNGGAVAGAFGGSLYFYSSSSADNATLIANGGAGFGGSIIFTEGPSGGTARVELFGNGNLNIETTYAPPSVTIGSLEGDGNVFLGADELVVGSNNLSTTFSGTIQDGTFTSGGSLTKIGTGNLTLSGANTYTGQTMIDEGTLIVTNIAGSATGPGLVTVNAGTLRGSGTISGAVTVAAGASLRPAVARNKPNSLTIQGALTLQADATYGCSFQSKGQRVRNDEVVANGVTISGASFSLQGKAQGTLQTGAVLTVISNTAATPIAGAFSNLVDGAVVTANDINFQVDYEGGDGNDLTLTVVP